MEYKELEVGEDSFIVKELISSYKEHIKTLEDTIKILRNKYEPFSHLNSLEQSPLEKYNPPTLKAKLSTTREIIQELERRTAIKAGVVSDEEVKS